MRHLFTPWRYALRGLVLRTPEGPRTPAVPIAAPPGLEPPPALPPGENGYLRLVALDQGWPTEGMYPPDFAHWRKALPGERAAAARSLAPLRPVLEGVDALLGSEAWQATIPQNGAFPELARLRRLGQALLLRGDLDGRSADRDRALELARRVRRCQGPFMHFLVGLALEKLADGSFEGLAEDRAAATRWELARFAIPRAHRLGPWEPVEYVSPPDWTDARRAVQWAVAGHSLPYEAEATVASLVAHRELMATGGSDAIQAAAESLAAPWLPHMVAARQFGPASASLAELRRIRPALRAAPNPYGRLSAAQTLRAAGNLARAAEKAERRKAA